MDVAQSLQGAYVRYAGAGFVARLHKGMWLVEIGLTLRLVGAIAYISLAWGAGQQEVAEGLLLLLEIIALALSTWGWWLYTSEHHVLASPKGRVAARWLMVVANLLELSAFTSNAGLSPSASAVGAGVLRSSPCVLTLACIGVWFASTWTCLFYAHGMARRVPSKPLADLTLGALWVVPLLAVLAIPAGIACFPAVLLVLGAFAYYFVVIDRWRSEVRALLNQIEGVTDYTAP